MHEAGWERQIEHDDKSYKRLIRKTIDVISTLQIRLRLNKTRATTFNNRLQRTESVCT